IMSVGRTIIKLLTFKISRQELLLLDNRHLAAGIIGTWLVGMGRYWDDPGAKLLQHLGLGSVIYIFCLSAFIWLIVLPFKPAGCTYKAVLTFVSLTSFPALLYAIPVERFFSIGIATRLNVWFLAIVATWRLALLFFYLRRFAQLPSYLVTTVALLPVCLIVTALSILNLERVVFNIMGGLRENNANKGAYMVVLVLTVISAILALPLLIIYIKGIMSERKKRLS
ncbi:MAG TPA: hypothetical protein VF476_00945, partial [Chitinophagaceae bacterium]